MVSFLGAGQQHLTQGFGSGKLVVGQAERSLMMAGKVV